MMFCIKTLIVQSPRQVTLRSLTAYTGFLRKKGYVGLPTLETE